MATSDKMIVDKSGPLRGTVSIIESPTTPKTYSIVYLAPRATSDFSDAVKYSDGIDQTVLVSVTASAELLTLASNGISAQFLEGVDNTGRVIHSPTWDPSPFVLCPT